jgi:beta-lactamase regulating signal transducer with metallopeptidase domain
VTFALFAFVDSTVVLALGLAAAAAARRRSAATRHALLAAAIASALLMPLLKLLLPELPVVHWPAAASAVSTGIALTSADIASRASIDGTIAAAGRGVPWVAVLASVWIAGVICAASVLATSLVTLARFKKQCRPIEGRWRALTDDMSRACGIRGHVTLLESAEPSVLVACGVLRPTIILPAGSSRWPEARIRIALGHELAHIRRKDAAVQLAGEALRTLHWINPFVWVACRRLRHESEFACDDEVLNQGVEATDYATELLDLARQLSGRRVASAATHAIAHRSTLERRIAAMLHHRGNRTSVGRRGWIVTGLTALGLSLPLAAASIAPVQQPDAAPARATDIVLPSAPAVNSAIRHETRVFPIQGGTISGRTLDQWGATLPGVQLTLTDLEGRAALTTVTDAMGQFAFRDLPSTKYELAAALAGFAAIRDLVTIAPGAAVQRTITMPLGTVQETITVSCGTAPLTAQASRLIAGPLDAMFPTLLAQEFDRVQVGGAIRPPMKVRDVRPLCPAAVPTNETTVRLTGRIDVDGIISDPKPVPSDGGAPPTADLINSAMDAVRQWRFTPTILDGRPVDVNISIDVTFKSQ